MAPYLIHFNMLQTISLLNLLVTVAYGGSTLIHDEECSALFKFKQSIIDQDDPSCGARGFQMLRSWKRTTNASYTDQFDCCLWYGVECSKDHEYGLVIGLDLSESFLCGRINSNTTIFSLVYLRKLNLAMNNFYESLIPPEISRLKQLRSLNLSDSGFTGLIPNEISQLLQLSSLDLSTNSLKLQTPSWLNNLVKNLTRLEELHLSGVDISSSVPNLLANFSSLRSIKLKDCSLWGKFPTAILDLPKLITLDVESNTNLAGSFVEFRNNSFLEHVDLGSTGFFGILPESISNLYHLRILRLTKCSFSGRIPASLSNLTQLTYLGLGMNKFTGTLGPSLVSLSKLIILELTGNKFEKGHLPSWLGKLTTLNELYIADMNINGGIPSFLANLTKLGVLKMGKNALTGHIPHSLFNISQLWKLGLQENQLQGPISSSFSNFKNLQHLLLQRNNFSGTVDIVMFLKLNKLKTLALGFNRISLVTTNAHYNTTLPELKDLELQSCNLKEFPSFLRFQHKLRILLLGHNKIDGMVPVWIWNNSYKTLQVISLSYNSITGFHHHPLFLPWRHLQGFDISNNQVRGKLPIPPKTTVLYIVSNNNLTGEIPPWLCELKFLRLLDLSFNNMSGTLPSCLGSLSNSLVKLNLRKNNFHGTMMDAFRHGSVLESIDLSQNGFVGQLPRSLTNCTHLKVLSLEDNAIHDVFPFILGTLPNLEVLILRSNKFYGPIQESIIVSSQFSKLRIIDLSDNGFSGQLDQKYFQNWIAMKSAFVGESSFLETMMTFEFFSSISPYSMTLIHKGVRTEYEHILTIFMAIDLSRNNFEGEIPQSLQDLRGLESLNLSNNHFTEHVLPPLGYLKNLESLDLSQNNLLGEIPQQLVQLNFLSIFNVSYNHLDGRIPHGKQFDTFDNNSYEGNPGLCGRPLSKECQDSKESRNTPESPLATSESLLPSDFIDWIFVFCGVGSGLVVGIFIGNILYERYSDRFTKRKDRWVRPLRNTRRGQGVISSSPKGKEKVKKDRRWWTKG